ncbi:MAG: hypothetical protein R3F49_00620 [Planctomycetota bacterium]
MRLITFAPAAAALALAPIASAQWADNFESYATGSAIEGQGGWHNWDSIGQGNQPYNTVVGATGGVTPYQGTKMLSAVGDGLNPGAGNGLSDSVHEMNGPYVAGSGGYTFTTHQYVSSTTVGRTYLIMLNTYADGGGPYNWSFQCYADPAAASVHMDVAAAAGITINGDQTLLYDQWAEYKIEIDLNNDTAHCYYNGVEMWELTSWAGGLSGGGAQEIGALDVYPADSDSTAVYYDEFSLALGIAGVPIGANYCNTNANSTGVSGRIDAYGSTAVASNDVTLTATDLPNSAFLFFLTSTSTGQINNPGGSQGNLCLGGAIGRYVGAGQIQNTGMTGSASLALNLNQIPTPNGFVAATAGQTWNYQAWHRDVVGGAATSNFTDATSVTYQ